MRTLVTGGAGFIGTNLVERLLNEGHFVFVVDNLYSGKKKNIERFFSNRRFDFLEWDITNSFNVSKDVEQIYHLACPASPVKYQENPRMTIDTSILGIRNMIEFANEKNARLLFTSTSEIYGNPLVHPQTEDYWGNVNTIGPRSCYDEGKRAAETFCRIAKDEGQDVRVVRIFNTYGPFMDANDGRVVSNFINQAITNQPITIYGSGKQTRSFCYVDDMVDGLIKFMNLNEKYFGPINLGNPDEFTMIELAEKVLGMTGSNSQIIFKMLPKDDPEKRKPDISRAKEILNWEPKIKLEQGLVKTIDYFRVVKEKLSKTGF